MFTEDDWSDGNKLKLVATLEGVKGIVDDRERISSMRIRRCDHRDAYELEPTFPV